MTSSTETLCQNLMSADSEADVIGILRDAGYWDDPTCWRDLGDEPENYSTVGNQQSRAEQALVEKLVNAIDTKLMAACKIAGINPEEDAAPDTMLEARERFFGEALKKPDLVARGITVAATGARSPGRMSISIADDGEGQTPRAMPTTILSVLKGSKKNVRFVQGRFHMGGTGVLEFCGRDHNVQFVLSRRNPAFLPSPLADPTDADWSFTIIRREDPQGRARGSRFTFLAPGTPDAEGRRGLLHFSAAELPIFPDKAQAYDYYINMDNAYLLDAIKQKPKLDRQFRRQFKLGMTIVALALVHQSLGQKPPANDPNQDDEGKAPDWNISDQVRLMTTAIAPFLLPMVESLGDLQDEDEPLSASAGEAA